MATVGQALTAPEAGWKRIDNTDSNILYIGDWVKDDRSNFYGGSTMVTNNPESSIYFGFTGAKIRIIMSLATNRRDDNRIKIDDVEYTFSSYNSNATVYQTLVFELTNLEDKTHVVEIDNPNLSTNKYLDFDAIDLDVTSEIKPPYLNKVLISSSSGNKSIGERKYGAENIIPIMTSNTEPSGVASASGGDAYKGFNQSTSATWNLNLTPPQVSGWLQYEFPISKFVGKYGIVAFGGVNMPKSWTFEGSNDGSKWTILDKRTDVTSWSNLVEESFELKEVYAFKIYRLNFLENNGGTFLQLGYINMYELIREKSLINITSQTEQNFINHGMDKSIELDFSAEISKKVFIEQSPTTLGSGKVFKKSIDTSRVPIKAVSIK